MKSNILKYSPILLLLPSLAFAQVQVQVQVQAIGGVTQPGACAQNSLCANHAQIAHEMSKIGKLEEALNEYQAAYLQVPDPKLLFNLGRVSHKLGRLAEAVNYYKRYLDTGAEHDEEQLGKARAYLEEAQREMPPIEAPSRVNKEPAQTAQPVRPAKPALALLGSGAALLIIGVGLGGGAIAAANQVSDANNNGMLFIADLQAAESRGLALQWAGITCDVIGAIALTAGAIWTGVSLRRNKTSPTVSVAAQTGRLLLLGRF